MPIGAVGLYPGTSSRRFSRFLWWSGIIGGALVVYGLGIDRSAYEIVCAGVREAARTPHEGSPMRTIRLVSTPTRNRRLNEIIGMVVLVGAGLLLLALATYTPADPSLNTVGSLEAGRLAHNWTGMVGAYLGDAMLQLIGVAAFFLPLVLGRLGLCWMRSRPAGSPLAKPIGLGVWGGLGAGALAMLPSNMMWQHALPIE